MGIKFGRLREEEVFLSFGKWNCEFVLIQFSFSLSRSYVGFCSLYNCRFVSSETSDNCRFVHLWCSVFISVVKIIR
jgi:hypothetical protein